MNKPLLVQDIMTKNVVAVHEEDNLAHILSTMEKFRFRHIPVIDGEKLVGLLSQRDMLNVTKNRSDSQRDQSAIEQKLASMFVADVMRRDIETIRASELVSTAAKRLVASHFGCLPVVDLRMNLLGIITAHDVLRAASFSLDPRFSPENNSGMSVEKVMTPHPITIETTETLFEAQKRLRQHQIRHLPVVKSGQVVGMLSERDVFLTETVPGADLKKLSVEDAMSPRPYVVSPEALVDDVALEMARNKYGAAIVSKDGIILGVLSSIDVMAALAVAVQQLQSTPSSSG